MISSPPVASLARAVCGATFPNPVLLAAGTAGFGRELAHTVALDRLGGIVTKAVSLEPTVGNRAPRVAECRGGMLNSVGLANPGVEVVCREYLPWLAGHLRSAKVLVNVVGFRAEEYAQVIARLEGAAAAWVIAGYEINLSCPNTAQGGLEFGAEPAGVERVLGGCRRATRRPLFAKLSPAVSDLPGLAAAAVAGGADGVTLVNTMPGWLDARHGVGSRLGNGFGGLSGPALLPVGLAAVRRVKARHPELPVIGAGGVRSAADVRSYLRAGADLVAIGTAALADPRLPERIVVALARGGHDD